MSVSPESSSASVNGDDPLRGIAPAVDDVEARRARASIESRLFSGPPQPVRVGRYRVEGRIGAGGMGVVYRAHDPELARDVAVKLMNADAARGKDPATARARLIREARAMARLAHPNVIHVYDVGAVKDGVFIAMELVEGQNLATWIEQHSPPWREILRKYVDAGRGLAAAHAAGIIHRDFKPENVLLGADGRVRVGDLGLAGGPAAASETNPDESQIDRDTGDLDDPVSGSLTRTGTLLGTPKYMAPEQESGAMADARSDQFSFCVALYEALYGYPPFAGDTVIEYRHNVQRGLVLAAPPEARVRAWVHAEIVRGLSVDPVDRHQGLTPLLDRLEEALVDPGTARRRRRRARRVTVGIGVGVVLAVGVLGMLLRPSGEPAAVTDTGALAEPDRPALRTPAQIIPAVVPEPQSEPEPPDAELAATTADEPEPVAVAARAAGPGADPPELPTGTSGDDRSGDAPARTKRRRKADVCYYKRDRFDFIQRDRSYQRYTVGRDGRCYDCDREAPDYRRERLDPSDCRRFYLCKRADTEDKCAP